MKEIWKDIESYEGLYQVSNLGRVKAVAKTVNHPHSKTISYPERIIFQSQHRKGYFEVQLSRKGSQKTFKVHRLVAMTFQPCADLTLQVNHKDGNKKNNRNTNLEWLDQFENMRHALLNGLRDSFFVGQYSLQGEILAVYPSVREIQRVTGFGRSNILRAIRSSRPANNFIWKFLNKEQYHAVYRSGNKFGRTSR